MLVLPCSREQTEEPAQRRAAAGATRIGARLENFRRKLATGNRRCSIATFGRIKSSVLCVGSAHQPLVWKLTLRWQGTDVGKTLVSTALCRASLAAGERVAYVKPIGTGGGPGGAGDDGCVLLCLKTGRKLN